MAMTAKELAQILYGREYGNEITRAEEAAAKEAGLVVMFGYSDDNVEVRGAFNEEYGAYEGTTLHLTAEGFLESPYDDREACEDCKFYKRELARSRTIIVRWCLPDAEAVWTFETDIPHEVFKIYDDGDSFCVGIVFDIKDLEGNDNGI
ncbi:MAG: hypothetical protein LBN00_06460 [Oscillospiraceae bacterium]|jgi:hypothetical protein|nr:hypothetical protein [Oscillospiraceae bacterium]